MARRTTDSIADLIAEIQHRRLPSPATCRQIRKDAGITLERAALVLGVSKPTLVSWESGRHRPSKGRHALVYRDFLDALSAVMRA